MPVYTAEYNEEPAAGYNLYKADCLKYLFIAHPRSIEIFKKNLDVILIDCTYKTNCYSYLYYNIVSVTGMNTTIELALCFLAVEKEYNYEWLIQQLCELF